LIHSDTTDPIDDPEVYLSDILERLPAMTNQDDLSVLLPSNWQPSTATPALEVEAAIMP
jgi:hypothetical protein